MFIFLFAYLFAYLTSIAYSCPPPFNDFRFADNATLLQETVDQYETNPELGWTHVINTWPGSSSPLQVWPSGSDGIVHIKYCWVDQITKDRLESVVSRAWNSWSMALGDAGPIHRKHRLGGLSEVSDFCFTDQTYSNWNPAVPYDTIAIMAIVGSYISTAITGYRPKLWDSQNGRHQIRVGWWASSYDENYATTLLVHELGHVFGLWHEHQRIDRESYVHFQCENLRGYEQAVAELPNHPDKSIEGLCSSASQTMMEPWSSMGFMPYSFSMRNMWEWAHHDANGNKDGLYHQWTKMASSDYDVSSVMHYTSASAAKDGVGSSVPLTVYNSPLVAWKNAGFGYQPPSQITEQNAKLLPNRWGWPSTGDINAIYELYPWVG